MTQALQKIELKRKSRSFNILLQITRVNQIMKMCFYVVFDAAGVNFDACLL